MQTEREPILTKPQVCELYPMVVHRKMVLHKFNQL